MSQLVPGFEGVPNVMQCSCEMHQSNSGGPPTSITQSMLVPWSAGSWYAYSEALSPFRQVPASRGYHFATRGGGGVVIIVVGAELTCVIMNKRKLESDAAMWLDLEKIGAIRLTKLHSLFVAVDNHSSPTKLASKYYYCTITLLCQQQ